MIVGFKGLRGVPVIPIVFCFPMTGFSQQRQKSVSRPAAADSMTEIPEVLVAPLFIETSEFTSLITMVNELSFAVDAEVVLLDRQGVRIAAQTVAFPAHSQETLLVGDLLRKANSVERMGSVEIHPDPAKVITMAIAGQISITGSGANFGQHIEEEFLMAGMQGTGVMRSAGTSLAGQPVVALSNTAATAQTATISCIAEKGAATQQQVQLAAGGSAVIQACTNSPNAAVSLIENVLAPSSQPLDHRGAFGISVAGDGKAGSLSVFGFSWRDTPRGAMLSSQNFVDAGTVRSGNTVFTGVPVGPSNYLPGTTFIPEVAVANFDTTAVNATVLFARTDDSGPTATVVATVSVPAMSSKTVGLPPLAGDPGLRNSFIVQSDAAPGTLFSSVVSVGSSGFGLVEQIGKDQQIGDNGGGHPWALTDGGQDAVLMLFNHSNVSKYFNVKIGNGGVLWHQAWQLAPMETRAISIRDLIMRQIKDQDGVVLPMTLDHGEISWFNPNPAEGKGRLLQIERSSQLVAGNTHVRGNSRMARSFSCGYNIVLCGATLSTSIIAFPFQNDSSPLALGPVVAQLCLAFDPTACTGQSYSQGGSGYNYNWQSNIPSIATVSGSATSSTATFFGAGVGAGSATGFVASASCNMGGSGEPDVQVPGSIKSVSTTLAVDCSTGGGAFPYGIRGDFAYQVYDTATPAKVMAVSGMACLERISKVTVDGVPQPGLSTDWSATCGTTDGSGTFHDTPYGYCSGGPSTYTATQEIKFIVSGVDYPVRTNSVTFTTTGAGKGTVINGSDGTLTR